MPKKKITKANMPTVQLVESDDGVNWTPIGDVKPEIMSREEARITNPTLNRFLPIDHRTPLGDELLGFARLPTIRRKFGDNCMLSDIKRWFERQDLKIERLNWTDVIGFIRDEEAANNMVGPTKVLAGGEIITLKGFIERYCDLPPGGTLIKSKADLLYRYYRDSSITLPKSARKWTSGQSRHYYTDDLIKNWPKYMDKISTLPPLKSTKATKKATGSDA